jgi:hypothetical protein
VLAEVAEVYLIPERLIRQKVVKRASSRLLKLSCVASQVRGTGNWNESARSATYMCQDHNKYLVAQHV